MSLTLLGREHLDSLGEFSPGIVDLDSTIQWPEVCWPSENDTYGHRSTGEGRLLVYVAFPDPLASHYWLHSSLSLNQGPLELVSARGPLENRLLENDWASHPGEPWDDWQGGLAASHIFGQTDRSLYSDLRASREHSGYFSVGRENLTEHGGALYDELERYFAVEPTLVTVLQRYRPTQQG